MGLVEGESAVGDALALTEQASEVRQLLQVQAKAREEQRSHRVQFQAQLDVVRGEATGLLAALAAAETENEQLREDAAARIELVRAVSERVGSLKQLALSDAAAAVGTARLIQVDAELAVARQDVARLQAALDAAIATHQEASDAQTTTQLNDTRRVESLQLDLRHALRSLRSAQQAAAERESRQLSALKAAEGAAAQPLHAELVTLAQQVHAYEKAALEQARAIEEEDAGQKVVVADAERLRMEVAEQAEQIAELRVRAADRSSVAEGFNAQLQSSNGALQASLASVESVKAQLASFQATSVTEAIGICSEQPTPQQTSWYCSSYGRIFADFSRLPLLGRVDSLESCVERNGTGLQGANDELHTLLDAAVADANAASARGDSLQAALDDARSDAELARERVAESAAVAMLVAEQSAADVAALESLEYLHELPSQTATESALGSGIVGRQALGNREVQVDGRAQQAEVEQLRRELSEALLLCESMDISRREEVEEARSAAQASEEKYCQLVSKHAAVSKSARLNSQRLQLALRVNVPIVLAARGAIQASELNIDVQVWLMWHSYVCGVLSQVVEAVTPRDQFRDSDSDDDESERDKADEAAATALATTVGSKRRRVATPQVVDLVAAVTSLRQERDRSVRVAAGLNRKLSTLMREQRCVL